MKITLERSGGFAGITRTSTIDASALNKEQSRELFQMVENAGFFSLPAEIVSSSPQPDRFQYTLTIEFEGKTHSVTVGEEVMPKPLVVLVKWLQNSVRNKR